MRTLILYATKSGASRECAELLAEEIADSTICDIAGRTPDIKDFDTIIVGSGVRLGHYSAGFTLDTYTHITNKKQEEAAEKMGNFMEQAI